MDGSGIWAIPLRECGIGASWNVPKRGADVENNIEVVAHFLEIWLEAVQKVESESGCDRRK